MLDIDDTFDAAQGDRQLAFWNGFHGARGFAPIPVREAERARPLACVLRPARTPSGVETRAPVRRPIRRIRRHWPETRILLRGDGHPPYPARIDGMVRGQQRRFPVWPADHAVLRRDPLLAAATDACALFRAEKNLPLHRTHGETTHAAKSRGGLKRRTIARINATTLAMDIRALVTSLTGSTPERP